MDWIFEHLQVVILVALGLGSVLKRLWESRKTQNEGTGDEDDSGEVFEPDEDDREPMMRSIPPPLTRHVVPASAREMGYDEAVANENAKALKHQRDLADRMRQIRETRATTSGGAAATRTLIAARGTEKPLKQTSLAIRDRLRNPAEVRRAVVMQEILDPPVSLR